MTEQKRKASHKIPEGVNRVKPGEYTFGPAHRIVQGDDKLWRAEGDGTESLKPMKSRGLVVEALRELGVVPEVPAEEPQGEKPADVEKAPEQPKQRPRPRKPAKEAATV
jgi:hypothetical protein